MFTDEKIMLSEFWGDNSISRPVECFFQDIQRTLDGADMETIQIVLLVFRDIFYGERSTKWEEEDILNLIRRYERASDKESSISVHQLSQIMEEIFQNANAQSYRDSLKQREDEGTARLEKAIDQFNKYRTLTCAEKQQKAFERQLVINDKKPPAILPDLSKADLREFCEELYAAKENYGFNRLKKEVCIAGYEELYKACRRQPIAAAFLPVILTIYSTDEKQFKNLYSYFKYKNRRLSEETKDRVIKLFTRISEIADKWVEPLRIFQLPVFRWNEVEDAFCSHKGLSDEESQTAKQYFAQYRNQNGLSKSQEGELRKEAPEKFV